MCWVAAFLPCEEKLMMTSTQLDFCWKFSRGVFEHVVDETISLGEIVTVVRHFGDTFDLTAKVNQCLDVLSCLRIYSVDLESTLLKVLLMTILSMSSC